MKNFFKIKKYLIPYILIASIVIVAVLFSQGESNDNNFFYRQE